MAVVTGDGRLGVRFFFVISGFLITWLLLSESASPPGKSVSLKDFYIRRALRILPIYFVYLAVIALVAPFHQSAMAWIGNLTFNTNIFMVGGLTVHLWSLAVEEQFYLIWPGVFVLFALYRNLRRSLWLLAVPILIGPLSRLIACKQYYPESLAWYFRYSATTSPTTSYFDSIAVGCVAAMLLFHKRMEVKQFLTVNFSKWLPACLLMLVLPMLWLQIHFPARLQALFSDSMQAFAFSLLLLDSVLNPDRTFYRFLNNRLICQIGVLSYSLYIWQQIFCTSYFWLPQRHFWWLSFPGWLVPTFLVAAVSFYCLERPLFRLRSRFRHT